MQDVFTLKGKVALVTGGGSGIGLGIARCFVQLGARVAITGRDQEKLTSARELLGSDCCVLQHDVREKGSHHELIRRVEDELGALSILVNNAGMHQRSPSLEVSSDDFDTVVDVNLNSIFSLSKEALRVMVPRGRGSIINISSMTAIYGLPQVAAYSSSKTALLGLTRSLASEYSYSGVRINSLAPGFIDSQMLRNVMDKDPARKARVLDRTPMKRFGTAEEIGYAAAFLASDASQFITGVCLPVDGGNSIGF